MEKTIVWNTTTGDWDFESGFYHRVAHETAFTPVNEKLVVVNARLTVTPGCACFSTQRGKFLASIF
jgi:hypothetical protein